MNRNPQPSAAPATLTAPDPDQLADRITYGILLAAFAEHGVTLRAVRAAWHAVIHSDAFEEGDDSARPVRD